jgi:hypothetical protein
MKKISLAGVFLLSIVTTSNTAHAANLRPPTGVWGFCTSAGQIGCIKKATITAPGAEAVVATTAEQVTAAGVTLRVECGIPVESGGGVANECSSDLPSTSCTARARPGGLPQLTITMSAQTYPTKVQLEIATGDYKPRFGMGVGTQKMKISLAVLPRDVVIADFVPEDVIFCVRPLFLERLPAVAIKEILILGRKGFSLCSP